MSQFRTYQELFDKYPELGMIAKRLADSVRRTDEVNTEKKRQAVLPGEGEQAATNGKRFVDRRKHPEHVIIPRYYKNGKWLKTPFTLKSGDREFTDMIDILITSFDPDGFDLRIYNGQKTTVAPVYENIFWINDALTEDDKKEDGIHNATVLSSPSKDDKAHLREMFDQFRAEMGPGGKMEVGGVMDLKLKIMEKEFEAKLESKDHEHKLKELQITYEAQIKELKEEIEDDDAYIKELEDEIKLNEDTLNGVNLKLAEKTAPPKMSKVLGEAILHGLYKAAIAFPKATEGITGLTLTQQKEMFAEFENGKELSSSTANENNEEVQGGPKKSIYSGLAPAHAEGLKIVIDQCKSLSMDDFAKIYYFFEILANQEGTIDLELLNKAHAMLHTWKEHIDNNKN